MNKGYSICFNEWALDKEIKNELGLLLIISSLCAEKGYCYASNKFLANIFNTNEITISRKIKLLENKHYISIEYEKRGCQVTSRRIRLTKMLIDDYQNCESTINKNVKENNISNNNTSNNNSSSCYYYIEEQFGRMLAPIEFQKIEIWRETFDDEIINYAVDIAILNGKKNFNYIDGIIRNWKDQNIKTLDEIKNNKKEKEECEEIFEYDWLNDKEENIYENN